MTQQRTLTSADYRRQVESAMTEKEFMVEIIHHARIFGWLVYHTHDSRHSAKGYPDLTLCHSKLKRILFMEVKTERGKVGAAQYEWLDAINAAGGTARVVRPSDWDQVVRLLEGGKNDEDGNA